MGRRGLLFNGYQVSVWDEKVLKVDSGDGCTINNVNVPIATELYTQWLK